MKPVERICEREGCEVVIDGRRKDARFCSDFCRYQEWDREHPRRPARKPHNGSANGSRRTSRDGSGAHLYLTADELRNLRLGLNDYRVIRKAAAAMERKGIG